MKALVIISFAILGAFIGIGIALWKILPSYSAYSTKWGEKVPLRNLNLWSIVTMAAALLLIPPMVEKGADNALQCLGFFAPIYLGVVALTPGWESNRKEHIIHSVAAGICAAGAFAWMVFVCHLWFVPVICLAAAIAGAVATKTVTSSYTFWLEMVMFSAAYVCVMI